MKGREALISVIIFILLSAFSCSNKREPPPSYNTDLLKQNDELKSKGGESSTAIENSLKDIEGTFNLYWMETYWLQNGKVTSSEVNAAHVGEFFEINGKRVHVHRHYTADESRITYGKHSHGPYDETWVNIRILSQDSLGTRFAAYNQGTGEAYDFVLTFAGKSAQLTYSRDSRFYAAIRGLRVRGE